MFLQIKQGNRNATSPFCSLNTLFRFFNYLNLGRNEWNYLFSYSSKLWVITNILSSNYFNNQSVQIGHNIFDGIIQR